jgi:predicted O-methyltransferase YrrM
MPGILNAKVEQYLAALLPKRDAVISDMERYAKRHDVPIIGPVVARSIYLFAQISGAKRIFEMGSAIGYSTIWLAPQAKALRFTTRMATRLMRRVPARILSVPELNSTSRS